MTRQGLLNDAYCIRMLQYDISSGSMTGEIVSVKDKWKLLVVFNVPTASGQETKTEEFDSKRRARAAFRAHKRGKKPVIFGTLSPPKNHRDARKKDGGKIRLT
jgi:hypothetical protein